MLTLSIENDIIIKNTQECLRIMKHRLCALVMICTVLMSLCGCGHYAKDKIFDTDVYGTYVLTLFTEDNDISDEFTLSLNNNGTYSYKIYESLSNGTTKDKTCDGNIESVTEINGDISLIKLNIDYSIFSEFGSMTFSIHNGTCYKYKNLLGDYIQIETSQIKNRSEFSIPMDNSGEYYLRFTEDGMCKSDNTPDEEQYYYKYKVKSDIIFIDYGYGYGAAYYIVDGGVFSGNGFRKSE